MSIKLRSVTLIFRSVEFTIVTDVFTVPCISASIASPSASVNASDVLSADEHRIDTVFFIPFGLVLEGEMPFLPAAGGFRFDRIVDS